MASHTDHHALLPAEVDLDSSSCEDEDDVDEDDDVSPSTSSAGNDALLAPLAVAASASVTVALPAISNGDAPATPILAGSAAISAVDPSSIAVDRRGMMIDLRHEATAAQPEEKKPAALDDSRKLFQRLWTDEDEIELLQGFLDYSTQRGSKTTHHHGQNDTALFYDQIKPKLQLEFNKNQLVEKLRRLKKKYRNVLNRISSGKELSFKSPHDQATFEISRKIWTNLGGGGGVDTAMDDDDPSPSAALPNFMVEVKGEDAGGFAFERRMFTPMPMPMAAAAPTPRSRKRSRPKPEPRIEERRFMPENSTPIKDHSYSNHGGISHNPSNNNGHVQGLIEETVKNCLPPVFKEFLSGAMGGGVGPCAPARGFGGPISSPNPYSLAGAGFPQMNLGLIGELASASFSPVPGTDERWRKQQILELEVYSKRLELVQDQIKAALEDLRSRGG